MLVLKILCATRESHQPSLWQGPLCQERCGKGSLYTLISIHMLRLLVQDSGSRVQRAAVHTQTHEHEEHRNKDEHSVGHNKEATQHDISRFPAFRVCAYVYEALRVFSDYFCPRNREMPNSCNYPVFCLLVSRDPFARSLVARGPVAQGPVAKELAHLLHKNCSKSDQK